jgi:RimJ/RimL family protein N-acetyltransferase
MNNPIFTGQLVRLVPFDVEEDIKLLEQWDSDSEYQRFLSAGPAMRYPIKLSREYFEKEIASMHFFIIQKLEDDQKIGSISLAGFNWQVGSAWVGIGIGLRDCWGKGFGTAAMRIILRYGFTGLNLNRIQLDVFSFNQRGIASYEKAGFKHEGRLRGNLSKAGVRYDEIFMGILRREWEQMQVEGGEGL